ncbi:MAG: DUF4405 domain-containing protein [Oscillospiraceae bacterium]|jgi:hypothetical protein|nr:DUF4405 domain-containing protein [Oscillospiraceae bacterium]MDD3260408.1 DUF4405 domain-containing protein [Oscillospiraceae bacterium]
MNFKRSCKPVLDLAMALLLFVLMAYPAVGGAAHEWLGTGMFACFLIHQVCSRAWYRALPQGKYARLRAVQAALNLLLFVCMVLLMVSGMILSKTVFTFINLRDGLAFARTAHLLASYWGFLLTGLHLGFHWRMVLDIFRKVNPARTPAWLSLFLRIAACAVACYGAVLFFQNHIAGYLFLHTQFVFFDYSRPAVLVFVQQAAMMAAFVWIGFFAQKLVQKPAAKPY